MMYDLKKHKQTHIFPSGTTGFISYERLAEALELLGELRSKEEITHFWIKDDGINFRTKDTNA